MSDHEIVRVPLTDLFFEELDDAFVGEKETSHDFVWGLLRKLASDGKMGKLNKSCTINIIKDGQQIQDIVKLRGLELEELPSNPKWISKNMEEDEVKYFEHKVTDKSWEYLKLFASFALLRFDRLGDSIKVENEKQLKKMASENKTADQIEEARKKQAEGLEKYQESRPKCIEETIFNNIYPGVYRKVTENVDNSLDKENEELYPKETPATTKA